MIALCTGDPVFTDAGENTLVTFPSGDGDPLRVVLTRNQLCQLMRRSQDAMSEAFAKPQPELTHPVPMRGGKVAV